MNPIGTDSINYSFNRNIPIIADAEVVVAGGGAGGVCAAVSAARQGAKVVLLERYGILGGMATMGEVNPFMSNRLNGKALDRPLYVDWCRKMWEYLPADERGGSEFDEETFEPETRRIHKDIAVLALEDLCLEAGVKLYYHHNLVDVIKDGTRIKAAVFSSKTGFSAVTGKVFIDGTGDADLAWLAGCRCHVGDRNGNCQPMSLCFKLSGVDLNRMPPDRAAMNVYYEQAKTAGEIDCPRENLLWWFYNTGNGILHFNTTRIIGRSGINGIELSQAEIEGRRQVRQLIDFLRKHVPGFANARLHSLGHHIGIRETRRVQGLITQTADDFLNKRKYPDAIARARYSIDIHSPTGSGTRMTAMEKGGWYEVSYRAIVAADCENLLIGCRAISFDHELHSSIRIIPQICSVGQAAGVAAALATARNVSPAGLDGILVRNALREFGADL